MDVLQIKNYTEQAQAHQIETPFNKRIKLSTKTHRKLTLLEHIKRLENVTNSNEFLDILCEIGDCIPHDSNDFSGFIKRLYEYYRKAQDSAIKFKLLSILGDTISNIKQDGKMYVEDLISVLKYENSSKVLSHGLRILIRVGKSIHLDDNQVIKFLNLGSSKLSFKSHNVQRHALLLLGTFGNESNSVEFLELISKYSESQDARVRAQSFNSMLMIISKRLNFPINDVYLRAATALKDDYECVRKEALSMIYEVGTRCPNQMIVLKGSDQQIRLIDDAFGKICSSLVDLSMHIRVQAAQLLGNMIGVSDEFLHQTLDKKLMSNMRRKKSLHERNYEHFTSGEWSTGKKWANDAPKEAIHANSILLMASGACGAFVQGLEDEFLEVRSASVDSMCRLALENHHFAVTSLDFLVDMFNDEIESVRLKAIYSLIAISKHIVLREDQLEIMLSSLEDYSVDVREGLHLMLGACTVSTQSCLLLIVQKVLDVLSKYPQDKMSAYGCLKRVGQKHPDLCMSLTPQLLQDHPYFDSAEKDVEDPAYVCVLIMLFNAAQYAPSMISLFQDITMKHYAYLRDAMPDVVPYLATGTCSKELNVTEATGSRQFLETLLNNVQVSYTAPNARLVLLGAAQDNLARLAAIDPTLSGTANFTAEFIGAQLLMEQLHSTIIASGNHNPSKECINRLMEMVLRLQNLFSNLTLEDLLLVKQISLRASALQLIIAVKDKSQSALAPCQLLLHYASDTNNFLETNKELLPDALSKMILDKLSALADPKPGRVYREIISIVQRTSGITAPNINTKVQMCKATILQPTDNYSEDNVLKVTAGLIVALPFVVDIENLQKHQLQNLRIRVKYPDQNILSIVPKKRDLKQVSICSSENKWKLRSNVLLSHGIWTEAAQVDISVCLAVGKPGNNLELCKPVKVLLFPKHIKRGI